MLGCKLAVAYNILGSYLYSLYNHKSTFTLENCWKCCLKKQSLCFYTVLCEGGPAAD